MSGKPLHITPPERTLLQLLAEGKPNRDIANHLRVSEQDVDAFLTQLFARMGAASRDQAVDVALRRGLVVP